MTSELLEAGRTVANGFVTPERTHVIASTSRFYAMDEKIAMGDGRFDQDKLIKVINEHARDALLIDMARLAAGVGLDHQRRHARRHRRQRTAAAHAGAIGSRHPRRRQIGRRQSARLPRGLEAARAKAPPAKAPEKKHKRRRHPPIARAGGGLDLPGAGAGDRAGRRAPPARLSERRLCAALSRAAASDHRSRRGGRLPRQAPEGSGAPSRRAHVLRGRRARGASQDRARAHAAHRARGAARDQRAVHRARFPQARLRGADAIPAAVAGAADPRRRQAARLARPRLFRHGDQDHLGRRLPQVLHARQAAPRSAPSAAASRRSRRRSTPGSRWSRKPPSSRPSSRSRSPNARG